MTRKGHKQEPPLHLDMDFGEALERFTKTRPEEVTEGIKRSKKKKPPGATSPRRPARGKRGPPSPARNRKDGEG